MTAGSNGDLSFAEHHARESLRKYREAAVGLLEELAAAGFEVASVADLHRNWKRYDDAIPILTRWLPRVTYVPLREDVANALGQKWVGSQVARPLIEAFEADQGEPPSSKWTIADALTFVADDSVFEDIARLARDERHGRDREMLMLALGNMKHPRAVDVLIDLLDDADVAGHAVMGLGRLKDRKARKHIEPFLKHEKAWVRQEAKRALAKIDRAAEKAQEQKGQERRPSGRKTGKKRKPES